MYVFTLFNSTTVSLVSRVTRPFPANSFFILSINAMTKSILGPVTIHICKPDNVLALRQSQDINRSITSEIPNPIAFFIYKMFVV